VYLQEEKGLLAANVSTNVWPLISKKQESSPRVMGRADGLLLDHEKPGPSAELLNGKNESNTVF
jgi:hypothetical protein